MKLMTEFYVGASWQKEEEAEEVSLDRLSLAGCIGVWSNRTRSFPLPLVALDGQLKITHYDKITRFDGLLPSETSETYLLRGSWTGQVDVPGDVTHGEGNVYLGNAHSPSETWGYIFERTLPFNPACELGFVRNAGCLDVLYTREYNDQVGHLVYGDPQILDSLGKIHRY